MKKLITIALVFLTLIIAYLSFINIKNSAKIREMEVRLSLNQYIYMIQNDINSIKNMTDDTAIHNVLENKDKLTPNFEITIVDYDRYYYEYIIVFDNNEKFKVDMINDTKNGGIKCMFFAHVEK